MELDRDQIEQMMDAKVTERFQNIGIYDSTPELVERTRTNFRIVNDFRIAKEGRQNFFKRGLGDILATVGGQAMWVSITVGAVWAWNLIMANFGKHQ